MNAIQEANNCGLANLPALPSGSIGMPQIVTDTGAAGQFAWEEFFIGKLRNRHTRQAYLQAVRQFLAWCEQRQLELPRITPGVVGRYFDELPLSTPSKKLHLAGIRSFLDVLVQRHVIVLNPALSVRTERHSAIEGKTPEITIDQARKLLSSIQLERTIDHRDRAIIAVLIYTAARAGAVAGLRRKDFVDEGTQFSLRFHEKGGKVRSIPVRHDLERFLRDYIIVANLAEDQKDSPLFRSASGRTGRLNAAGMSAIDVCRMVKRRLAAAELPPIISPHSFLHRNRSLASRRAPGRCAISPGAQRFPDDSPLRPPAETGDAEHRRAHFSVVLQYQEWRDRFRGIVGDKHDRVESGTDRQNCR